MTILADETLVAQDADLLGRLKELLAGHPAGGAFQLLLAPNGVSVADDEVLVQEIDTARRVVELRPRKLSDVSLDDVLHTTQVTDPTDEAYGRYVAMPMASDCRTHYRPDGSAGHLYVM
ncbi:hypothetical protein OG285_06015 [Streptomyces sp. NBC_01471]|uniref:hypothetical protein n=1 Tax=Streptomyces sp. NBC_01471 TaxID=2903879 RepID=UPI00324D933E